MKKLFLLAVLLEILVMATIAQAGKVTEFLEFLDGSKSVMARSINRTSKPKAEEEWELTYQYSDVEGALTTMKMRGFPDRLSCEETERELIKQRFHERVITHCKLINQKGNTNG